MKKTAQLVSLVLSVLLILSFSGCEKQNIYNKYLSASEKTEALNSIDASVKMTLDLKSSGMTFNMPVTYNMKALKDSGDIVKLGMDMNTTMLNTDYKMGMYYADGCVYINSNDTKYKADIDYSELSKQYNTDMINPLELNEDVLKSASYNEKDGETKIDVVLDGEIVRSYVMEIVKSYEALLSSTEGSYDNIDISDVTASFTIDKNGYISDTSMIFEISSPPVSSETSGDSSVTININMDITINNPGSDVIISEPDGIDEYQDIMDTDLTGLE